MMLYFSREKENNHRSNLDGCDPSGQRGLYPGDHSGNILIMNDGLVPAAVSHVAKPLVAFACAPLVSKPPPFVAK